MSLHVQAKAVALNQSPEPGGGLFEFALEAPLAEPPAAEPNQLPEPGRRVSECPAEVRSERPESTVEMDLFPEPARGWRRSQVEYRSVGRSSAASMRGPEA